MTLVASIQYRALADKAADAFYKLSNTNEQIQAYVFDGWDANLMLMHHSYLFVMTDKSISVLIQSSPIEFQHADSFISTQFKKPLLVIPFTSLAQLVGPLESTSSPHYECKEKEQRLPLKQSKQDLPSPLLVFAPA